MKFSDVLEKHIYTVDFNPVRQCEFDGKHLAVVLNKNKDNRTITVVPLTRSSNGEGVNKYNIGKIESLPNNLKNFDSYIVYNQIRTVNCSRLYSLKDDLGNRINCNVDDGTFNTIVSLCLDYISENLSKESQLNYFKNKYIECVIENVINLAYEIKRIMNADIEANQSKIQEIQSIIVSLLSLNIGYNTYIKDIDKLNEIDIIIENCLSNSIILIENSDEKAI